MACDLINGISMSATCDDYKVPGISRLLLLNESDLSGTTAQAILQDEDGEVTGMTTVTGSTPYEIEFAEDTAFFTVSENINGGTRNFTHSVTFGVVANTQGILATLKRIGIGRFLALVKTNDETWRLLGTDSKRLRATSMEDLSGQNAGDDVATTVTIEGTSRQLAPFINQDVIDSLGI